MTPNNETRCKNWLMKRMTGGTGILPAGYCDNSQGDVVEQMTATGFDFEPLPSGNVLIEFFGDDGVTINSQVVTRECLARIPVVAHAFFLAVEKGPDAASDFLKGMAAVEGKRDAR